MVKVPKAKVGRGSPSDVFIVHWYQCDVLKRWQVGEKEKTGYFEFQRCPEE
jgi:hypothetical protein